MSVDIKFAQPERWHIGLIASEMRSADVAEVLASHGHSPLEALEAGVSKSDTAVTVLIDGTPGAIFGIVKGPVLGGHGTPWLLGVDSLFKCKRALLETGREVVSMMLNECETLENYVHVENEQSVRWLGRLGFQFDKPAPYGVRGELFMRFYLEKCDV